MEDTCGSMPYTEPLTALTSLSIVPNGDVMACGFVIGNLHNESIGDIVSSYDPFASKWMRALIEQGAAGLLTLAKENGIAVDLSQAYSICDICHQINKTLQSKEDEKR